MVKTQLGLCTDYSRGSIILKIDSKAIRRLDHWDIRLEEFNENTIKGSIDNPK